MNARPMLLLMMVVLLVACQPPAPRDIVFEEPERQQQLRTMQSATFAAGSRIVLLRSVLVTLQDLGFVIDRADSTLGYLSASKLDGYNLHISVLVGAQRAGQIPVRVRFELSTVMAFGAGNQLPENYQAFFSSLQKNLQQQELPSRID